MGTSEWRKRGRLTLAVIATALLCALLAACGGSTFDPAEAAASHDLALLKAKDYASSYASLSAADRAKVTKADWTTRCKEVDAATGGITAYRVIGGRYLDAAKTIVAVEVEVDFAKIPTPRSTALYYEIKGEKPVQTMLWGRTVDLAKGVQ